jgi:hypothetical protein
MYRRITAAGGTLPVDPVLAVAGLTALGAGAVYLAGSPAASAVATRLGAAVLVFLMATQSLRIPRAEGSGSTRRSWPSRPAASSGTSPSLRHSRVTRPRCSWCRSSSSRWRR